MIKHKTTKHRYKGYSILIIHTDTKDTFESTAIVSKGDSTLFEVSAQAIPHEVYARAKHYIDGQIADLKENKKYS